MVLSEGLTSVREASAVAARSNFKKNRDGQVEVAVTMVFAIVALASNLSSLSSN